MLKFEINPKFRGGEPTDTVSAFLEMASTDGYFPYEDDLDAVITMTDC